MENIYELYTVEQLESVHNSDMYTMFYAIVGNQLIEEFGLEGESVLREATRRYGKDRGEYRRRRHLDANIKINMKSLFSIGSDLPPDPRFERDLRRLIPEDRTCPHAALSYGGVMEKRRLRICRAPVLRRISSRLLQFLCVRLYKSRPCKNADTRRG